MYGLIRMPKSSMGKWVLTVQRLNSWKVRFFRILCVALSLEVQRLRSLRHDLRY
jgi:hypothetical protein